MDKDMNRSPVISVILPVYNAEQYLRECLDSILQQSYREFELIIINDGSTDDSEKIIHSYTDARIVYMKNEMNLGLIASLNMAIGMARGELIARMDADDVCMPTRFETQYKYMQDRPALGLTGSWFWQMHGTKPVLVKMVSGVGEIRAELLFRSVFAHPTVMMKKSVLKQLTPVYDPDFPHAEDYDLWTRMAAVTESDNIQYPLLKYRMHAQQVTKLKADEKEESRRRIMQRQLSNFGVVYSESEFEVHYKISGGISGDLRFLGEVGRWLEKLVEHNFHTRKIDHTSFRNVMGRYWLKACENSGQGRKAWKTFRSSDLSRNVSPGMKSYLKFAAKLVTGYKQHG